MEKVHFHEIADWHSLMDIVAAGCIAAKLAGARWTATPPPLGGGRVNTTHGVLPVPAPATCALLEGYPWRDDGIAGERVTPTGAAILRHLVSAGDCNGRSTTGRMIGIGSGAGTRTLPGTPNIVRALLFERERPAIASDVDGDIVSVLEFDVDDMTGEEIALAADRLRALSGVIDASLGTRIGKKGRPLTEFRVLANPAAASTVAHACFTETSTLGLRVREERRHVLRRAEVVAKIGDTDVNVKVAQRPGRRPHRQGGARRCRRRPRSSGPPQVERLRRAARAGGRRAVTRDARLLRLVAALDRHDRLAIAVSGGVDSMTLAHVAARHSRTQAVMYHAASAAVPESARQRVEGTQRRTGGRW